MRVARVIVALVLIGGASATADPVAAQEPGVTIDPGSPAGKEYGFPLDVQRAAAVGQEAVQGVAQPLFGVGVRRSVVGARSRAGARSGTGGRPAARSGGSRAAGTATSKSSPSGKGTSRGSAAGTGRSRARAAAGPPDAATLAVLRRPGGTTLQVALAASGVLLAGLAIGAIIALARRRRA